MSRLRKFRADKAVFAEPLEIVRVWALRALMELNGHREFVMSTCFSSDALANYLGLGDWVEDADGSFDRKAIRQELQRLHRAVEADANSQTIPAPLSENVQRLASRCGLSDTDCRILEFMILIHNERLLGEAVDSLGRVMTRDLPLVLSVLLRLPVQALKDALRSISPLAQSGLVKVDHGSLDLTGKLELISDDFADRMCASETEPITLFRDMVIPTPPAELGIDDYTHIAPSLAVLLPYLRHALGARKKGVNVMVYGVPGTGKSQLARTLAGELECQLYEVTSENEEGEPINGERRLRAYRITQNFFGQQRALIVFDESEDVFADGDSRLDRKSTAQSRKAWMNRMLEGNQVPTIWISNHVDCLDPAYTRRFDMVLELPIPPKAQRQRIIQQSVGGLLDTAMVKRLAGLETLAPAVVARAVEVVHPIRAQLGQQTVASAVELLVNATLEVQGHAAIPSKSDPNNLPETYDPAFICADVDLSLIPEGLARTGAGRLCLYGPPGTGKTAYGRWLADQLGKPLLVKRGSDLISMWVGGTEKNIARAFKDAASEDAVLLIDEVDSFLQDRRGAQRSWEVTGVNEMLTQMESFDGVFVASTNLMDNLDQAALRRFDLKVKFGFLRAEQALALFTRYCEALGIAVAGAAVRRELGCLGKLTPGDFAAVARQHRFRPLATADAMVAALRAECEVKEGSFGQIGFL
ncbi:MAG TPA: ATP-binding protein [Eoetvoesiella sp.]